MRSPAHSRPPPGPIAPTYKTLSQIEPRIDVTTLGNSTEARHVISSPGSYYLSGAVQINATSGGASLRVGISIEADDVTLDLNGYKVQNVGDFSAAFSGIRLPLTSSRITIRNGTFRGFPTGIDANDDTCVRVQGVTTSGGRGVLAGSRALIEDCIVEGGGPGVQVGASSMVSNTTVDSAFGAGFVLGDASRASQCVARQCTGAGFDLAQGASVENCSASNCVTGIAAIGNASILDCNVQFATTGINLTGGGCRVERCKVGNASTGVQSAGVSTITGNTLNAAAFGVGTGILLNGQDDHVESNHIYVYATGVAVNGGFSTVLRNSLHLCTTPVGGAGLPSSIAPVVSNAAALATNPVANIAQ